MQLITTTTTPSRNGGRRSSKCPACCEAVGNAGMCQWAIDMTRLLEAVIPGPVRYDRVERLAPCHPRDASMSDPPLPVAVTVSPAPGRHLRLLL